MGVGKLGRAALTQALLLLLTVIHGRLPPNPPARIEVLVAELPDANHAHIVLQAQGTVGALAHLVSHQLTLDGHDVPLEGGPDVVLKPKGFEASFVVALARIPEAVLSLDPHAVFLHYQAESSQGKTVLVAEGILDLTDPSVFQLPLGKVYTFFAQVEQFSWTPSLEGMVFKALLSLYNPFSFPVTIRRLDYRVSAGRTELFSASHPGIRLKSLQRSDVLLEQEIPLRALAVATQILWYQGNLALELSILLETPAGPKTLQMIF